MKDRLIASLVGGIIIFFWQFFSWTISGIHNGGARYHPQQTEILNALSQHFTEDGVYMLPTAPPGASRQEHQNLQNSAQGKPFATIMYVKSYGTNMTMAMIRGFLVDVFLVYLLIYLLTRAGTPAAIRIIAGSVSVGLFSWLWGPYTAHIWFQVPWPAITGDLVDAIVAWALCGIWAGWFLNRRNTRPSNT